MNGLCPPSPSTKANSACLRHNSLLSNNKLCFVTLPILFHVRIPNCINVITIISELKCTQVKCSTAVYYMWKYSTTVNSGQKLSSIVLSHLVHLMMKTIIMLMLTIPINSFYHFLVTVCHHT